MGARGVKRWAVIVLQVTAAVLVGLAVRELWLAVRGESGGSGSPSSAIAVTTSVTPTVVAFGTPVVATADVVADARVVRPDTIRLQTDFTPYEAAGEPTVERTVTGDTAHVVFRFPLRCLREGCDPAGARGVAQFEPGLVRYRFRDSPGAGRDIADWPSVEVASRVRAADVEGIRWRASQTELSPVTTRFGPKGLAIVLLLGAGALVGGGRMAGAPPVARPARAPSPPSPRSSGRPLERALDARAAPRATAPRSRIGGVRSSGSHGSCRRSGSTSSPTRHARSRGHRASRPPTRSRASRGERRTPFPQRWWRMTDVLLRRRGIGLPTSAADELRREHRRTRRVRVALALAALALLAGAFFVSRDLHALPTSYFATGSGGIVVLDLSTSVDAQKAQRVQRVLQSLSETEGRVGLVVFSDSAYEMLPPDTRSEELRPLLRFFAAGPGPAYRVPGRFGGRRRGDRGQTPTPPREESPWSLTFRGGTRISTGLAEARAVIDRERQPVALRAPPQRSRRLRVRQLGADRGAPGVRARRDRPSRDPALPGPGGQGSLRTHRRARACSSTAPSCSGTRRCGRR